MMRRIRLLMVLTILLIMAMACGGGDTPPPAPAEENDATPTDRLDEADPAEAEESVEEELEATPGAVLQKLTITGNPRYGEAVRVELRHGDIPQGMSVRYRWWVNENEIQGQNEPILPPGEFRPKDWLFCMAQLQDENDEVQQTLHSNRITVLAQPPKTIPAPISPFSIPGEFRYQIQAMDPNEPEGGDGRTLSYELLEPQSENIVIQRDSGLLTWMLDAETAKRLADQPLTIRYKVLSSWGTGITGSITLNLKPQDSGPEPEQE